MANIDRIVNVQIALNTTGVSKEGFSTMLVLGEHLNSLARVISYTSVDDMIADGFTATDPTYLAVNDAFSQTPRPKVVKVGRRQVDTINVNTLNATKGATYAITISSKNNAGEIVDAKYEFINSGENSDAAAILAGLQAKITADKNAIVNATVVDGLLKITVKNSGTAFKSKLTDNLTYEIANITETIAKSMELIIAEDNDFYGICMTSRSEEDILALADWTESHIKLFGTSIAQAGAKDASVTNDIGSKLKEANYYRTFWFYHEKADTEFPECANMTRCFAINPGGETWANKKLAGVSTDPLTETEYKAITFKNGNTFETVRNVAITQNGKVTAGEWIDVIRFRDWLQEEISTNIFNLMINRDKIPYTDAGIAIIENQIRTALDLGQERGGIAPTEYDELSNENQGYTISVPLAANIPANTKANRILEDISFTARLAGAIHAVEIKGNLTYENLINVSNVNIAEY